MVTFPFTLYLAIFNFGPQTQLVLDINQFYSRNYKLFLGTTLSRGSSFIMFTPIAYSNAFEEPYYPLSQTQQAQTIMSANQTIHMDS